MGVAAASTRAAAAVHALLRTRPRRPSETRLAQGLLASEPLQKIVGWYVDRGYGTWDGPGPLPYYCDAARVGNFAVDPTALAAGAEPALLRLFVGMAMYQALRDVVIMRQQRAFSVEIVDLLANVATLETSITANPCSVLGSAEAFEKGCSVAKDGPRVDCGQRPGASCHVKDATAAFNRMGDMGKLPTSAWLRVWRDGGMAELLTEVYREEASPTKRAVLLVDRFAHVHRVGRKLATMFVSALSTPALAPGLTPWFPEVDGNDLVVVDTNVAQAVDALREPGAPRTYDARERWLREQAALVDLRALRPDLPRYSPRLVQQALYAFCSKSNRQAQGDPCAVGTSSCEACVPALCPFAARQQAVTNH